VSSDLVPAAGAKVYRLDFAIFLVFRFPFFSPLSPSFSIAVPVRLNFLDLDQSELSIDLMFQLLF